MELLTKIRDRWHPLHQARKWGLFQALVERWDPMVPARISGLKRKIFLRLFAHAALLGENISLEESIRKTIAVCAVGELGNRAFWDVGANIGLYSFSFETIRPGSVILSFEPDQRNLECLRRSSAMWRLPKHQIIAAAVSDFRGCATFKSDRLSGATGSLMSVTGSFNERHYGKKSQPVEVDVVRLDDFFCPDSKPGVIKIDVEGAEVNVLRGACRVLSESTPVLLFESFEHGGACAEILKSFGYELFDADHFSAVSGGTTNFLALAEKACSREFIERLRDLGYPV